MSTPVKLGAFAVALVAVFALALGLGGVVGPVGAAARASAQQEHADGGTQPGGDGHAEDSADPDHADAGDKGQADELPGGLQVSAQGYTLALAASALPAGPATSLSFQVLGPDGHAVTDYERSHDKDLHLIVVRRDLTAFQHVHPQLAADGTWSVPLDLSGAGSYRVFADFVPAGADASVVLGADLEVAGEFEPRPLPAPAASAQVDGYTVTLDGELRAGRETELTLSVAEDGAPVTDLQPYLGAYGHLVALRAGDLAYLHVHPTGHPGDGASAAGPDVTFATTAPSPGTYRLFLDFKHADVVRTAELTVEVTQ